MTSNLPLHIRSTKELGTHEQLRQEAQDAIDWTQMMNKRHYDRKHSPLFLKVGEYAKLHLTSQVHPWHIHVHTIW